MKYDIITVGEILAEIVTDSLGQTFRESGLLHGPYPSGAPAIMIDQAARQGVRTAIMSKVGDDDFGRLNIDRLASNGVDVQYIIVSPDRTTGTAFVTYFADGSRQFIFHFSHAACGSMGPEDLSLTAIKEAEYLHVMGCSITASSSLGAAVMETVRTAAKHRVKISFDPNVRPELLQGKIMDYYHEILGVADIVLTGKSELKLLFSSTMNGIARLMEKESRVLVIKDGSRGTSLLHGNEAYQIATFTATEVDPTGAGDCFDGTFLASLVKGCSLRDAVIRANAAGSLAVEKRGPMEGNSGPAEIDSILKTQPVQVEQLDWRRHYA